MKLIEAIAKNLKTVKGAIDAIGFKNPPSLKVENDDPMIVIDDAWYIVPFEKDNRILWQAQKGVVVHGIRYYPDGSGEPDDYDIVDIGVPGLRIDTAIQAILQEMVSMHLDNYFMAVAEAEMMEAEEEWAKQMAADATAALSVIPQHTVNPRQPL